METKQRYLYGTKVRVIGEPVEGTVIKARYAKNVYGAVSFKPLYQNRRTQRVRHNIWVYEIINKHGLTAWWREDELEPCNDNVSQDSPLDKQLTSWYTLNITIKVVVKGIKETTK